MKTREIFGVLREHIEPPLLELGLQAFKDPSGLFLIWTRPRKGRRFETVACQADNWPCEARCSTKISALMSRSRHTGSIAMSREAANRLQLVTAEPNQTTEA